MDIELLAPAGSMDSLVAAVENGADAVYIGGKNFSARQFANNFDEQDMLKAIEYCHIRGVKVYVTLNILIKEYELKGIPEYVLSLYNAGADALIIQDIGVGNLIRHILPEFELHASTQVTAHNLEAVNLLYDAGYKRVVLSRELSLREIEDITKNTKAEIEVFSHGALCICYSGQCLMSSMIGGRSGNRGMCAQPCRQKYALKCGSDKRDGYVMSPKDLSTIDHIGELINSGIKSLKVEGRMKRPEYVAAVISIYRKAIDSFLKYGKGDIDEEDKLNLLRVFNRGGFTTAHLFGKGRGEMMSVEKPKNWGIYLGTISKIIDKQNIFEIKLEEGLSKGDGIEIWTGEGNNIGFTVDHLNVDGKPVVRGIKGDTVKLEYKGGKKGDRVYKTLDLELMKTYEKTYSGPEYLRKIPVNFKITVRKDEPVDFAAYDCDGNRVCLRGGVPEKALKVQLTDNKIIEQVSKLGSTPFIPGTFDIELDQGLSLSAGEINSLRRDAIQELTRVRAQRLKPAEIPPEDVLKKAAAMLVKQEKKQRKNLKISVFLNDSNCVDSAVNAGADMIIFGGDRLRGADFNYKYAIKKCKGKGVEIYLASPRIIRDEFDEIYGELEKGIDLGGAGIYADNLGMLQAAIKKGIPYSSGFSLNIFNSSSIRFLNNTGSKFVSLSPELSLKDIRQVAPYVENCEALCYGRIEMMVSEYCPAGSMHGCTGKNKKPLCESVDMSITDKLGMIFPVRTDKYCRSHIYNSRVLNMLENLNDIISSGIDILSLNLIFEDADHVYDIVKAFKDYLTLLEKGIDSIPESAETVLEYIKNTGATKGHYYRGAV